MKYDLLLDKNGFYIHGVISGTHEYSKKELSSDGVSLIQDIEMTEEEFGELSSKKHYIDKKKKKLTVNKKYVQDVVEIEKEDKPIKEKRAWQQES